MWIAKREMGINFNRSECWKFLAGSSWGRVSGNRYLPLVGRSRTAAYTLFGSLSFDVCSLPLWWSSKRFSHFFVLFKIAECSTRRFMKRSTSSQGEFILRSWLIWLYSHLNQPPVPTSYPIMSRNNEQNSGCEGRRSFTLDVESISMFVGHWPFHFVFSWAHLPVNTLQAPPTDDVNSVWTHSRIQPYPNRKYLRAFFWYFTLTRLVASRFSSARSALVGFKLNFDC